MREFLARLTIASRVAAGCTLLVLLGGVLVAGSAAANSPGQALRAFLQVGGVGLLTTIGVFVTTRWLLGRELRTLHQLAAAIDSVELDGSELYRNLPARGPAEIERIVAAWNGFA
ncbi:MAG: hypothetical protein IT455_11085, partial [Planctomycetes bacterium]|nr:hypothetical protein [Planctomycetota bacterium]